MRPGDPRAARAGYDALLAAALVLVALAALVATWIAVVAPPPAERANTRAELEKVIAHTLALELFERDLGMVQQLLTDYAEAGYIASGAVADKSRRVIATVRTPATLAIGATAPAAPPEGAHTLSLGIRSETFGELIVWPVPSSEPAAPSRMPIIAAALLAWIAAACMLAACVRRPL